MFKCTRRGFLSLPAVLTLGRASQKGRNFAADWERFSDPVTEFQVLRLTDPEYSSFLPPSVSSAVARRDNFLLYCSDRNKSLQLYRLDLKTRLCMQLTSAKDLQAASVALLPDEQSCCYVDGSSLRRLDLVRFRDEEVYAVETGWRQSGVVTVTDGGKQATLVETRDESSRVRLVSLEDGSAQTVVEGPPSLSDPMPRPRQSSILYRREQRSLWLVDRPDQRPHKLELSPGTLGPAFWSRDGQALLYLNIGENGSQRNTLREHTPEAGDDKLVSITSQFVHFGSNHDGSAFVGASAAKHAPYILLLLRRTRRELTLCEHGASDPASVAPIFSPESDHVYFQSDKHGKPAIYRVFVGKQVEAASS